MNQQTTPTLGSESYRPLQILFMLGCFYNIVLTFVPSMSVKVAGFFKTEETLMSGLDAVQFAFKTGQTGIGLLFVLFFAAWVAALVMAAVYQRRWVFIGGAVASSFYLLLNLFSPKSPNVEYLAIARWRVMPHRRSYSPVFLQTRRCQIDHH